MLVLLPVLDVVANKSFQMLCFFDQR